MKRWELAWLWLALLILTAVAVLAFRSIDAAEETLGWVEHTDRVLRELDDVSAIYSRAASARRAYVVAGDATQLADAHDLDARLARTIASLRTSIADNSGQLRRLDSLAQLLDQRLSVLDAAVERRRLEGTGTETAEGLELTTRIRALREEMSAEETRLLGVREARTHRDITRTKVIEIVGTVTSFAILLFAFSRLRREIGTRRKAAAALQISRDAVVAANQELEAFSYSVAHDLRAPLRSIDGFSQALEEDYANKLDAAGMEHLKRVRTSAQHMGKLIDGLLGLSRLSRTGLVREKVDMTRIAHESCARLREAHPQRQVELVVQDGLEAVGDARLLPAVMDNLLANAWKFTSKCAHPHVEVGRRMEDGSPVFYVRDNGAGFEQAYVHKLFGAFQRLHTVAEFEGSGIGLATVQRILRMHGGRAWAEGEVGHGATFYFTL